MCCLQLRPTASPKAMPWFPVQEAEMGIPRQPAVLKDHQQHLRMAGMDQNRNEGLGSKVRCITSSTARSGPCRAWRGLEDCWGEQGRGNLSLRLPAVFNAGAGHRPVLSWTMEKRMRLEECTFWMRGPPETDDFCPGQEGRQGERADENLTSAPDTTRRPWTLSPHQFFSLSSMYPGL